MADAITTEFKAITVVDISKQLPENIQKMNVASGKFITAVAKSRCPVDTARLRNSISYSTSKESGGFNDGGGEKANNNERTPTPTEDDVVVGGTRVFYGIFVNLGTKFQAAQPFFTQALQAWAQKGFNAIAKMYGKF